MNFRHDAGTRARSRGVIVDLTALIDVVFQLLIFFLLTSSYVSQQASASPQVPVDVPESSLDAQDKPHAQYTIAVTKGGEIFIDDDRRVTIDELTIRLVELRQKTPSTIVLLRGDENVSYGRIAQIMTVIRAAGLPISAVLRSGSE